MLLFFAQICMDVQSCCVYDKSLEAKARTFIENVLPIDIKHYSVNLGSYEWEATLDGKSPYEKFTFDLNSRYSNVEVDCEFQDDFLYCCFLRVTMGTLSIAKSNGGWVEVVRSLLENDEKQTGFEATRLTRTLDSVNLAKNQTITCNHMILMTSNITDYAIHFQNGRIVIDYSYTMDTVSLQWADGKTGETVRDVVLHFGNGAFTSLTYDRAQEETVNSLIQAAGQSSQTSLPTELVAATVALVSIAIGGLVFRLRKARIHRQLTHGGVS